MASLSQKIFAYFQRKDLIYYHIVMLMVLLITWLGFFDAHVMTYVNTLRSEVFSAFIGLKSLESVASIFADSNASLGFFGTGIEIAIGRFLDPLLSFSEKASNVMLLSILSLTLQKFVIILMSASTVKLVITANVIILYANQVKRFLSDSVSAVLFKLTIIFVVLKMFAPLAMFLVSEVSDASVGEVAKSSQNEADKIATKMEKIQSEIYTTTANEKKKSNKNRNMQEEAEQGVQRIKEARQELQNERNQKVRERNQIELDDEDWTDPEVLAQRQLTYDLYTSEIDGLNNAISKLDKRIEQLETSPGFFDAIILRVKSMVDDFNAKLRVFIESIITTLMLFLLRTILIPIFFLWLIYRFFISLFGSGVFGRLSKAI